MSRDLLDLARLAPIVHPPRADLPVLLSVPHSGRDYPDFLVRLARRGEPGLRRLEDPLVDRLAWRAMAAGIGAVVAVAPRALIDCNRDEDELDPLAIAGVGPATSLRARAGLGLVASRTLRDGPLWRRTIDPDELEDRLRTIYRPYHAAIDSALSALRDRFGAALLIDCHSMPPPPRHGAQIVIGDRHGQSAAAWLTALACRTAEQAGFRAATNTPYAGGAITARHGRPAENVHAIQVEIDRSAYLARDLMSPGHGFDRLTLFLDRLAQRLGGALRERSPPMAEAAE